MASGPSCTAQDAQTLAAICDEVICVNDSWRLLRNCQHIWATDHRWYEYHIGDLARDYEGQLWTQHVQWPSNVKPEAWGITCLQGIQQKAGLSTDPAFIHTGQNSGYAAVGLAYRLGAKRIILLGFDMMMAGDKRHWFGAHPVGMEVGSNYTDFIRNFSTIDCGALGIEILNATRRTALDCFPKIDLDDYGE